MNILFLIFFLLSIVGFFVGLAKPSIVRVKSRKQVSYIFGGAIILFFILFGVTAPPIVATGSTPQQATNNSVGSTTSTPPPQASAPAQMQAAQSSAVSSLPSINDASYVSYWNQCLDNGVIADYETQWTNLFNDSQAANYAAAVQDTENMQKDLTTAQTTCLPQLEVYKPITSDIAQANTLTKSAISKTIPELKPILADMQNDDNGTTFNNDLNALTGMDDYGSAKKIIQAWQAVKANSSSSPEANDASYVSYWNTCVENDSMNAAATDMQNLSTDGTDHNYLAAIKDVEYLQTDVLSAQNCLPQLASYQPLTPDVAQINTITVGFLSNMSSTLNNVLTDMQNADYGMTLTNDMVGLLPEVNSYNKARELIAAWQSKNPQ